MGSEYSPEPFDKDPDELDSLADFHETKGNARTASILRAYAATLRQQAGFDGDPNPESPHLTPEELHGEAIRVANNLRKGGHYLAATIIREQDRRITAALAQNTQGDDSHVERARVPDGWSGWCTQYPDRLPKLWGARVIAELNYYPEEGQRLFQVVEVAAAPSQRAEVKE